ncbi:uncharacterized protein LOC142345124 [Convolutriloba macropyga]|uniref:uncharacterized protein LOC142345124 n=1 Tax=Convolutriloba macropyga TaxID=536237 RepID=UPI003F528625
MQLGLVRFIIFATCWYLVDGCSAPDAPSNLSHVAFGSFRVNITWDDVTTSPVPDSYQVKDSSGTTHSGITTNYFEWPSTLVASTEYKFDVRSVYNCPSNSSDLFSDWVEVTTYTGPEQPDIQQSDYTSTSIEVDVVDSNQYDTLRLFVDGAEVSPSPSVWPVEVTDLTPGQSYTFYVIGTKYGWSAQSENLKWCTKPDVPTNLYSVTRYFYGFNVKFDQPSTGFYTGYEVWVDADSVWRKTTDDSGVYQKHYYFYNFGVTTDFNRNKNLADLYAFIYNAPQDFAYNSPRNSLSSIQSGTNYVIKARSLHMCTVHLPGASESLLTFYSEEVTGTALTGAHPVVKIQTVPVSETEIDISFEPFSTFPAGQLTFNIYRYFNNTMPEQKKIENITLSDLPYRDSNLQSASVYTYDISVVFGGYETFDYSRIALEAEYWPGTRGDPRNRPKYKYSLPNPYAAYQFDFNREANWKDFTADDGTPPTFVNIYDDISADHNLFHFYFREKTTCTFPPAPTNVTFTLISDTELGLSWHVEDFSHAQHMHHSEYGSINVSTSLLLNGTAMFKISDDYSTSGSANVTGLSGKSLFSCQVVVAISCPDDKTHQDTYDYGYARFDYIDYYQFVEFNMDRGKLDSARDILSSNSGSNPGLDQVVCYTAKEITAGGRRSVVGGRFQEVGGGITASGALSSGPIGRMSEDRRLSIPSS